MTAHSRFALTLVAAAVASAVVLAGGVKIKTQYDKEFNFSGPQTYAWHPDGAGDVKVLEADVDSADIKRRLDPMVMQAVDAALKQRGFTRDASATPTYYVYYYALIGPVSESQTMGQFLPAVPFWGLPPFPAATQSMKYYERGSLILDVSSVALKSAVWRGIAEAEIDRAKTDAQRQQRITEAFAEMLKKFPPKKK
ncbi:MAG: DUF4136 domain-containing protein [Bacteroidales bacterium]